MNDYYLIVAAVFIGLMLGAILGPSIVYVIVLSVSFSCLLYRRVLSPLYVMFKQWRSTN